jgi:photosystem II stability/assembly factor-like uncharacterized protein
MKRQYLLFFFLLSVKAVFGQWTATSGPKGGLTFDVTSYNNNLYIATYSAGVLTSNNNGQSWAVTGNVPNPQRIFSFGGKIFAGTQNNGVYVSSNGTTWASNGVNGSARALGAVNNIVFAGYNSIGVYRSLDSGKTWQQSNTGLTSLNVTGFASLGSLPLVSTSNAGLFMSPDSGKSWTAISKNQPYTVLYSIFVSGKKIYAGTYGGQIIMSNDTGATWTTVSPTFPAVTSIISLGGTGSTLFLGTERYGAYRSTDNGSTWTQMTAGYPTVTKTNQLQYINGTLFAANSFGLYSSTDDGLTWNNQMTTYNNMSLSFLFASGTTLFAGGPESGLYRSTDNGVTWALSNNGIPVSYNLQLYSMNAQNGKLLLGVQGPAVFESTDNGATWTIDTVGIPFQNWNVAISSIAVQGSTIFAASYYGIYASTDAGKHWYKSSTGIPANTEIRKVLATDTALYAAVWGQGVFKSTDNGATWAVTGSALSGIYVTDLALSGKSLLAATTSGMLRSDDNGVTWQTKLASKYFYNVLANGSDLFTGVAAGYVWYSPDTGNTWTQISGGMSNLATYYRSNAIIGTTVYAAGEKSGVYKASLLPVAPSSFSAQKITYNGCILNWTASLFAHGYTLSVATDSLFTTPVAGLQNLDVGKVLLDTIAAGLNSTTTYFAKVTPYGQMGAGASAVIKFTTLQGAPLAPQNVIVKAISKSALVASWSAVSGATGYYLDVATDSSFNSFVSGLQNLSVGNVLVDTISTNLLPATLYYVRVRAANSIGQSPNSLFASATTLFNPGYAVVESGTNYAAVPANTALNLQKSYTIEAWVNMTGNAQRNALVSKADYQYQLEVWTDDTGPSMYNIPMDYKYSRVRIPLNTWIHIAATFDLAADELKYFIGGTLKKVLHGLKVGGTANGALYIGGHDGLGGVRLLFDGKFDEVRIWNTVRTADQILANMNSVVDTNSAGLVAYYRCDDNNLNVLRDYSPTKSDAVFTNPPTFEVSNALKSPYPVTITSITGQTGSFLVKWNKTALAEGYYLDVATDSLLTYFVTGYSKLNVGNVDTFKVTGLVPGKTYYCQVKPYNSVSTGECVNPLPVLIPLGTDVNGNEKTRITSFAISQNFPNPFNPSTTINYQIPEAATVSLAVYSIQGRLIAQIVKNQEQSAGYYNISLDADKLHLASGMYIYQITAVGASGNTFVKSQKMILLK